MTTQLLLSLSILIAVHEWGHFITARMFKIKVEKFYLFFDFLFPMANVLNFSLFKYKKGDTEYGIGWFPLGGYVKIAGMVDESMDKEQMKSAPEPWEFRSKPAWQRLIVMLGGIIVNVIVGVLIFIGLAYLLGDTYIPNKYINTHGGIHAFELAEKIGLKTGDKITKINGHEFEDFFDISHPNALLSDNPSYTIERDGKELNIAIPENFIENFNSKEAALSFVAPRFEPVVGEVTPTYLYKDSIETKTIASKIGLKKGDRIVEVNGQPIQYQDQLNQITKSGVDTIVLKVAREGETLTFTEDFRNQNKLGFNSMGIDKKELAYIQYGFGESIVLGTQNAFGVITNQIKAFGKIFTGKLSLRNSLSGPIGIAKAYGGEWDWERFWRMTGLLSMVLAFMNLLPIPALDGGYVMFLLYEMITGREPSEKFFETALKIGFAILIVLMVFVFYNDIFKAITGG